MLKTFRVRIGIQSRRPKPSKLPLRLVNERGETRTEYVAVGDYPAVLTLPHFPVPGILDDRPKTKRKDVRTWFATNIENLAEVPKHYGAKDWTITSYRPLRFSQMLAKIAHAHASAVSDCELFAEYTPLLPEHILGDAGDPCFLVGSPPELPPPSDRRAHVVETMEYETPERVYLVIAIRLFAELGSPQYYVVAGVKQAEKGY